jgi:L-lactate dehydrogenase (cytochrome)
MLSWDEVEKHVSQESCWVVIKGEAYDLTAFLDDHPGGAKSILRWAGKDGTEEYEAIHPPGTIEKALSAGKL